MNKRWLLVFALFAAGAVGAKTFDVRDFGAKGDGTTKDTAAIQRAIDAASDAGGGTVEFGPGTYLSGSLWLKSNLDFHVGAGARLQASPDRADYNAGDAFKGNWVSGCEPGGDNCSGGHLLIANDLHHVTLRGPGRIDGNGPAFLLDPNGKPWPKWKYGIPWRPSQMIWFKDCTNIRITDIELTEPPYWTCLLLNCSYVQIRGCHVHNVSAPYRTLNGDGFDIDRCRFVTISDCIIDVFDDALTLRASFAHLLDRPQDCECITVDNCTLSGTCDAIRIGVGEGTIRNAVFSNLVLHETDCAINLTASYNRERGVNINGISFKNIRVSAAKEFLRIHSRYANNADVCDLRFEGIDGTSENVSHIWAHPARPFRDIRFKDVNISKGVEVINADCTFDGGTFREVPLTAEEKQRRSDDIAAGKNIMP